VQLFAATEPVLHELVALPPMEQRAPVAIWASPREMTRGDSYLVLLNFLPFFLSILFSQE
jgi:hypothetical protein